MLQLIQFDVRVGVVDERVEEVARLEDAHALPLEGEELAPLALDEVVGLMAMVLAVELANRIARRRVVVAVVGLGLRPRLGIHARDNEFFPGVAGIVIGRGRLRQWGRRGRVHTTSGVLDRVAQNGGSEVRTCGERRLVRRCGGRFGRSGRT